MSIDIFRLAVKNFVSLHRAFCRLILSSAVGFCLLTGSVWGQVVEVANEENSDEIIARGEQWFDQFRVFLETSRYPQFRTMSAIELLRSDDAQALERGLAIISETLNVPAPDEVSLWLVALECQNRSIDHWCEPGGPDLKARLLYEQVFQLTSQCYQPRWMTMTKPQLDLTWVTNWLGNLSQYGEWQALRLSSIQIYNASPDDFAINPADCDQFLEMTAPAMADLLKGQTGFQAWQRILADAENNRQ